MANSAVIRDSRAVKETLAVIFLLQEIVRASIATLSIGQLFFELENGVEYLVGNHEVTMTKI